MENKTFAEIMEEIRVLQKECEEIARKKKSLENQIKIIRNVMED